jgi:hypothetical protein
MERYCNNCALKTIQNGMCPIFGKDMTNELGCPYYTTELKSCDICGNLIPKGGYIEEDNGIYHLLCSDCATSSGCRICKKVNYCPLEQDTSCPEPLYIMVTQRQGNMTIQNQQINPKRVELTCPKCDCYNIETKICFKRENCSCANLEINWRS